MNDKIKWLTTNELKLLLDVIECEIQRLSIPDKMVSTDTFSKLFYLSKLYDKLDAEVDTDE